MSRFLNKWNKDFCFSKWEGIFLSPIMKLTNNFILGGRIYELEELLLKLHFSGTLDWFTTTLAFL